MKKRRILSCVLAAGVMLSSGSVTASVSVKAATYMDIMPVAEASAVDSSDDLSDENLTKVLSAVKLKINIPKEYTVFSYEYSAKSSYNDETWYFYWQNESGDSYISMASDKNANIMSYKTYNYANKSTPVYLKSELQSKADEFIKKTASNISTKLQFTSSSYSGSYSNNYYYVYTRIEDGVLMTGQQVTVGVNAATGKVESFDNNSWNYDIKIPSKDIKVTKEQAVEKLHEQITMNLKYKSSYTYDTSGKASVKAYLAYEPSISYISVDAATGKIYTTLNQWNLNSSDNSKMEESNDSSMGTGSRDGGSLTDEEMKKVAELEGLITKQEAVDLIKKNNSLYLDTEAVVTTASLTESSSNGNTNEKNYYWNIQFSKPNTDNQSYYYSAYTRAVVNAKTGEIVSFYSSIKDYYYYMYSGEIVPAVIYTKAQSQKILENFAKTQNKERFDNTKLSDSSTQNLMRTVNGSDEYGGYSFNYNRVYSGIEYADNQVYGAVDAVTGKITSYGYNWNDSVVFEEPKNTITAKEAFNAYISYDGFGLVYELNTIQTETSRTQEVRLAYQVNITPAYVSAFTGKQLDDNGKEYKNQSDSYNYTDIKGHMYEKSIRLLADLGTGFASDKFEPDKAITKDELQQLIEAVTYVNNEYKLSGSAKVSRQEAANYAVNILGLKKIAGIKGIYQIEAEDVANIKDSYVGFVAIAKGLGILKLNDKNEFRPTESLTRAEAADMLLMILGADVLY